MDELPDASAPEILIVDGDSKVLRGLERLFREAGLTSTAVTSAERGLDQIANRFFPVALVDLDTPRPLGGLDLLRFGKDKSPLTAFIVLTARTSFDAVAAAFRAGAVDVVPKTQESVGYLRERVLTASREVKAASDREKLLGEVSEIHEDFLRHMIDLTKQVTDLEDKLLNRDGDEITLTSVPSTLNALIVDDDPALPAVLQRELTPDRGWNLRTVLSGGEALDSARGALHVLVVKSTLPDLPGTMVVKTLKAASPDLVALVFSPPTATAVGEVKLIESSRLITIIPEFSNPDQLLGALADVREALKRKAQERRYLTVFRKQHFDFLKRYNLIKQRLAQSP